MADAEIQAKKIPAGEGRDFADWWRWAESNRRPEALRSRDYMLSRSTCLAPEAADRQAAREPVTWI